MWSCRLCEKETVILSNLCEKCRKIKHLINLYGDDVYSVLDQCLIRNKQQQTFKVNKVNKKGLETDNSNDREYKKETKEDIKDSIVLYKNVQDGVIQELKQKLTTV
tara:strand:+ start:177 stop:494 length:318 start_codon:yes stop_codon:yes gene_type:complete